MHLPFLHRQQHPADILLSHSCSGILEAAGDPGIFVLIENIFDRIQARFHVCIRICGLSVRQDVSRFDRIPSAEFPGIDPDHFRQKVNVHLRCKTALRHTESAEGPGYDIIGIDGHAENIDVLIVIRSRRMRTGSMQYRAAKARVCAGIRNDDPLHAG